MARNTHKIEFLRGLLFCTISVVFFLILHPQSTFAFDNNRVIDDSRFSSNTSMNESQIQAFLAAKGSYLTSYTVPPERDIAWQGVTYHESPWIGPTGGEVNATGWSASHVIYQVSQWYGINPQVLLATLQKESSLVTNPSPPYYGLVQWAMGYAYTEGGILNACGTATNHNPTGSCAGFAMQMDWAGGGLKSWMNLANAHSPNAYQYWTGNTINIDGQWVHLSNGATAALYRYTPHIQTSFYNNFTRWFGSTLWVGPYVVANASAPEPRSYYLVDNGKKMYLSYAVYINWGLNSYPVDFVGSETFNSYPETTALTNYAQDEVGSIFVIDQGQKKWVPDWAPFDLWGFDRGSILPISSVTLNYVSQGLNFSYIVKAPDPSSTIYLIDGGIKRHILKEDLLNHLGVPSRNICIVSVGMLDTLSQGEDFGSFIVKGTGDDEFVLDNGVKRHVPTRALFDEWNFNIADIGLINDITLTSLPTGLALSSLAKRPGDAGIHYIESGARRGIVSLDTFNNWGFSQSSVFTLASSSAFAALSSGAPLTRLPRSMADGKIYLVENGTKRWIKGVDAFNLYGFSWNDVTDVAPETLNLLMTGTDIPAPLLITEGHYVFYVEEGKKRYIVDPDTFNNWGFSWGNVVTLPANTVSSFPTGEILTRFVRNGPSVYLVQNNGFRWVDHPDTFNFYNFNWNSVVTVSDGILASKSRLSDLVLPQLVTHSYGGAVYFIENYKKRAIQNPDTFNNWGFSWGNIIFTQNNAFLDGYLRGDLLTRLVKDPSTGHIYLIENRSKRWITSVEIFNSHGFSWNEVFDADPGTLNGLEQGTNLSS